MRLNAFRYPKVVRRARSPYRVNSRYKDVVVDALGSTKMVDLAIAEMDRAKQLLVTAIEESPSEQIESAAHRLKGVILQCQMSPEADLAARVEAFGRVRQDSAAAEVFEELLMRLDRVDEVLKLKRVRLEEQLEGQSVA